MFDFRLKVFYTVAKRESFTKAAKELLISQPAVSKHIREIESHYQTKLFARDGINIRLTESGQLLYNYAEDIFSTYRNLEFDMHALNAKMDGNLRIGASTTVSQYVLPPLLAEFRTKVHDIHLDVLSENSAVIEQLLLSKTIDVGIVEGCSKNPQIKYVDFIDDEIVLVCRVDNPKMTTRAIDPQELKSFSFLLREAGSGTLDVIERNLNHVGLSINQLRKEMNFSSTESIKMYLKHSDSFAFLSIHAILKELKYNELAIVDIDGLEIKRKFSLVQRQGQESALVELFTRFIQSHNFKL